MGWRRQNDRHLSFRRFLTSPRGAKAVLLGSATWTVYEGVMVGCHKLDAAWN